MRVSVTRYHRLTARLLCVSLLGTLLAVSGSAAFGQDDPAEKQLINEIWQARAAHQVEIVNTKLEELKKLNPKSPAIAINAEWAARVGDKNAQKSPLDKPADWVPQVQPTPVPTPRPTPVPQHIIVEKHMGFIGKVTRQIQGMSPAVLYGSLGAIVLIISAVVFLVIRRRRSIETPPVQAESVLGSLGTFSAPTGAGLGGLSLDPLGSSDPDELLKSLETPQTTPAPAPAAAAPEAQPATAQTGSIDKNMTDSTVNLLRSFGDQMKKFGAEESEETTTPTPAPDKQPELDLTQLFDDTTPTTPSAPTEKPTAAAEPITNLTELFNMDPEGKSAPQPPMPPAPEPEPKVDAPESLDLTALFAETTQEPTAPVAGTQNADLDALFSKSPLGTVDDISFDDDPFTNKKPEAKTDDDGDDYYATQMAKAQKAFDEGRYKDAVNYLSIVTSLNPDDIVASTLLEQAKKNM